MSFQGSDTTRVLVRFHPVAGGDRSGSETLTVIDSSATRNGLPNVVGVSTSQQLGAAYGSYAITLKAERGSAEDALMNLEEEDWAEIVFYRFDGSYFGMRGPIDLIQRKETTVNGATSRTFQISGRTVGKAFAVTSIWFDFFSDGEQGPGLQLQVFEAYRAFLAPPNTTVRAIMGGFLDKVLSRGRAIWEVPPTLRIGTHVATSTLFHDAGFVNYPVRVNAIHPSIFNPGRPDIWSYAQGNSDPEFCELFIDALDAGSASSPLKGALSGTDSSTASPIVANPTTGQAEADLGSIRDAIIFRDRPFLSSTWRETESGPDLPLDQGPMSKLVTVESPRRMVASMEIARNGMLRRNTFMCSPAIMHQLTGQQFDLQLPLQDADSVRRHGFRRMDATTQYFLKPTTDPRTSLLAGSRVLRDRLRDFHCMNHLFWNGTVSFVNGRPDLRIGNRLRIVDETDSAGTITFYVEAVSHSWSLSSGLRTSATVSRGFFGSDNDLLNEFRSQVAGYGVVTPARVEPAAADTTPHVPVTVGPHAGIICQPPAEPVSTTFAQAKALVMSFRNLIEAAAAAYPFSTTLNLPRLLASIMYVESAGRVNACSSVHAESLMQVWPGVRDGLVVSPSAYEWHLKWIGGTLPGNPPPRDLGTLVNRGAYILQDAHRYMGVNTIFPVTAEPDRTYAAISAYNAGPLTVVRGLLAGRTDYYWTNGPTSARPGNYRPKVMAAYDSVFAGEF